MNYYLPTLEEVEKICSENEAFYLTETEVNGYSVKIANYRLASYTDYLDNNAWELRGLCFVNNNGSWERNILMNKFFNLNETQDWMLEDVQDKKVTRVQEKLDGSIISFVRLPNGKIVAKSKMSFDSDQAKMAQDIFDNSYELRGMVETIMDDNKTAIFELISPFNQIVLPYNETELRLLQIRDNKTGEYASTSLMYSYLKLYDLQKMMAEEFEVQEYTWDKLLELQQTEQNIEGWIVTLEDGQMLKCKTSWYFAAHHLTTDNVTRENLLLELVLTDKLDDVLCVVQGEKKKYLEEMSAKIQHNFNHLVTEYKSLRGLYFNKFQEDRKEFALKYKNHELFNAVMKTLNTSFRDVEDTAKKAVTDFLLKKYNTLTSAREFLNLL